MRYNEGRIGSSADREDGIAEKGVRQREAAGVKFHQRILQWQADHPNITWLVWGIVWLIVLLLLFRPVPIGAT